MCYGQTGAGKTYTMTGATENYKHRGILPRALQQVENGSMVGMPRLASSYHRSSQFQVAHRSPALKITSANTCSGDTMTGLGLDSESSGNSGFDVQTDP